MPWAIVHLRVTKGTLRTTRWLATMATSKPSSCRRRRSRLRLISCGDMEHHSFDHMDGLAGEQRTLGQRRRTLSVADGERDIRTRRRGLESQLDQFFKDDGDGLPLALARVQADGDQDRTSKSRNSSH